MAVSHWGDLQSRVAQSVRLGASAVLIGHWKPTGLLGRCQSFVNNGIWKCWFYYQERNQQQQPSINPLARRKLQQTKDKQLPSSVTFSSGLPPEGTTHNEDRPSHVNQGSRDSSSGELQVILILANGHDNQP